MIASAVVANVCVKLAFLLAHQLEPLWNLKDDMKSMQSTLENIQAVLSDAERRSLRKGADSERLWLKKLKKAAYEIDDLLSDFEDSIPLNNIRQQAELFLTSSNPLILPITLAYKMKRLKRRLDKIASERRDFDFKVDNGSDKLFEVQVIKNRETCDEIGSTDKNKIVGRDEEKKMIINFLLQTDVGDDISTIFIVGLGGLGKTTLAKLIFNDESIEKEFDIKVWVYVSMDFDLLNIGKGILSQIDSIGQNHDTLQSVSKHLKKAFTDKRFLIVLDDLWEEDGQKLERLNLLLKGGKNGSKVIVTTRSQKVAQLMSSKISTIHSLDGLSDEHCWSIFSERAFISYGEVDSRLAEIGRQIIKKCKGIPLAAIALGYILHSKKDVSAWSAVRDSEFWQLDDGGVLPSLKLSYYQLPPPLKLCFAYCAIFPKGFDINKENLVQQWIALEFIQDPNRNFMPEKIGEEYVNNLLGMSFLQYSPNYKGSQNVLCMHDLVHDVARSVVGNEMLVLDGRKEINGNKYPVIDYSYYSLVANYENVGAFPNLKVLPDKVRALHFNNCTPMLFPAGKIFKHKRSLRVLNFSRCKVDNLPDSVYHLKQLRYLEASQVKAKSLSESFGNLVNMVTLDLSKSYLERLPTSINKLQKLKNLSLHGCSMLRLLPESFSKLKFLTHLDLADCCGLQSLPESFGNLSRLCYLLLSGCSELRTLPDSISHLTYLIHLDISGCTSLEVLPQLFGHLSRLQWLYLSGCSQITKLPDSLGNITGLQHLNLSDCSSLQELPESFGNLCELLILDLSGCYELSNLPQSFCKLERMEHLNLSLCDKLSRLPDCFGNLKNLKFLNLSSCSEIRNLPESFASLLNLEEIDLSGCSNLEAFPESITKSDKLQKLDLNGCSKIAPNAENSVISREIHERPLDTFECKEIGKSGSKCSNIVMLKHKNQIQGALRITCIDNVHNSEEAETAKLCNKSKLRSLMLHWSSNTCVSSEEGDKLVLEKLQPHRNLEVLTIDGYRGTRLPGWTMGLENSLPNLTQLTLCNLPHCEQLPPFEHLTNLEVLEIHNTPKTKMIHTDMQPSRGSFRKLKIISIRDMPDLEAWSIAGSTNDTKLEKLNIYRCPRVIFKPCLPSTETLVIIESSMALSWAGVESLSFKPRISKLNIGSCTITSDEWGGLGGHIHIKDLEIKSCKELYFLPKGILDLTSLESLTINNCNSLSVLPEWLGELVSLRSLSIISCLNLKFLPLSIQGLTALENLHIRNCSPALVERCLGVDKNTISHVRNVYIPNFTLAFCERSEEAYHKMAYRGVLGVGAFGPTYKALLGDGQVVAVKALMKLNVNATAIGFVEPHLVYDFMPMGSLFSWLYGTGSKQQLRWEWDIIYRIIHDVAHGLKYIHSISPRCAHGNITTSNVLVFGNNNYPEGAKITNYGLANLIGGPATSGYTAPELIDFSQATQKSDVYSFGVLLLEVLTGWEPEHAGKASVLGWVQKDFHGQLFFTGHSKKNPIAAPEMNQMSHLAMECVSSEPESRPTMDSVARRIEDICNLLKIIQPRSENIGSSVDSYGECAFSCDTDKEFCQSQWYFDD